jgi:Leucine-rich repeat (LRR) protein/GTPase SAR1 family protein
MADDANAELKPSRIPLLGAAKFQKRLDRVARGAERQLHLLGPRFPWSDEVVWDELFRAHGTDLDRKTVFRVPEIRRFVWWAEPVSLQVLSLMGWGLRADVCDLLGTIAGLKSLNLAYNQIGDEGAIAIAERLPGLISLDLLRNGIGDGGVEAIAERLHGLISLNLSNNLIADEGATAIAERLSALTSLYLSMNEIGDEGAKAIAERLSGLTSLDLGHNTIGDEGAKGISEGCPGLTSLNLCYNHIGDGGAKAIGGQFPGLTYLDLGGNQIREAGAKAIAEGLSGLTRLDLGYNRIGDGGAKAIAEGLSGLTYLDLADNRIGDVGAKAIAEQLSELTSLDLGQNQIGAEGAKAIAERLSELTSLDLGQNQIRAEGAKAIAERLSALTSLDLRQNLIGAEGAKAISKWLPKLAALYLWNNEIGDEGAKAIAEQLCELISLNLGHNGIGNEGAKAIAERLSGLTSLELGHNGIGNEGAIAIAERLSKLNSLDLAHNHIGDEGVYGFARQYQTGALQLLHTLNLEGNRIRYLDGPSLAKHDAKRIFEAVLNGVALPHARIMLVGMGGVGKSLLARRTFLDCVQEEGPHAVTHDIVVLRPEECRWMPRIEPELKEPRVQIWVWDFAGQLVTHGVHESFLADEGRTVYVVVLAADREPDQASVKYDGNRLRYWLQMLRYTVGSVAPVIIVITRNDKCRARQGSKPVDSLLNWAEIRPQRALKDVEVDELSKCLDVSVINVVTDFSACDATYPIREGLQRVIQDAVLQLGVGKEKRVPREFVPLKKLIDDRLPTNTLIARTEFDDLCAAVKIESPELRSELLRMLHHMGSLIYWGRTEWEVDQSPRRFHDHSEDQRLGRTHRAPPGSLQTYVLNPQWFKTCVYAITRASEELIDGKPRVWLTPGEIDRIVAQASAGVTPSSGTRLAEGIVIREALKFIGVCWEDEASGDFLFPRGLPEKDWTEYLAWSGHRLTWDFLPEHCVAKLLVRLHQDGLVVARKRGSYVHDRNAALITYPPGSGNQVLVSTVPEQGHVEIRYSPATPPEERRSALQHLLVVLQARELQGRPPVISQIGTENAAAAQAPTDSLTTTVLRWQNEEKIDGNKLLSRFYEIGYEFQRGCKSQKQVSDNLVMRETPATCPKGWRALPAGVRASRGQVSEACQLAMQFFAMHWNDPRQELAELFTLKNRRHSTLAADEREKSPAYTGLSELGLKAWRLTADYLGLPVTLV